MRSPRRRRSRSRQVGGAGQVEQQSRVDLEAAAALIRDDTNLPGTVSETSTDQTTPRLPPLKRRGSTGSIIPSTLLRPQSQSPAAKVRAMGEGWGYDAEREASPSPDAQELAGEGAGDTRPSSAVSSASAASSTPLASARSKGWSGLKGIRDAGELTKRLSADPLPDNVSGSAVLSSDDETTNLPTTEALREQVAAVGPRVAAVTQRAEQEADAAEQAQAATQRAEREARDAEEARLQAERVDPQKELKHPSQSVNTALKQLFVESYTNSVAGQSMKIQTESLGRTWRDKLTGSQPETAEELNKYFLNFVCETRSTSEKVLSEIMKASVIKLLKGIISIANKHADNEKDDMYDWKNHGVLSKAWQTSKKLLKGYKEAEVNWKKVSSSNTHHNMYTYLLKPALEFIAPSIGSTVESDRVWNQIQDQVSVLFVIISLIMELIILDVEGPGEIKFRLNKLKEVLTNLHNAGKLEEPPKKSSFWPAELTGRTSYRPQSTQRGSAPDETDEEYKVAREKMADADDWVPSLDEWQKIVETMTDMKNHFVPKKAEPVQREVQVQVEE
jgi:hypothetical protein